MWRSSLSFSSKLSSSAAATSNGGNLKPTFLHSLNGNLNLGIRSHSLLYSSIPTSTSITTIAPPPPDPLKLGFPKTDLTRSFATSVVDLSSLPALSVSKARNVVDSVRGYGRCYWELSKPRLREMGTRQRAMSTLPTLIRSLKKLESYPKPKPPLNQALPSLRRAFSLYDQINLIDNVPEDQLRFQGFTDTGFTVNGVQYEGSLLCVGNLLTSWSPKMLSDINEESLSIFKIVRPIPEILILGCGRHIQQVDPELRRFIRSMGMKLETLDSRNAASTYNILNEEGRIVAAALLPYGVSS